MKRTITVFTSLLLCACATVSPVKYQGNNGKASYSMTCSGMGRTMGKCYYKANELCPSGYTILSDAHASSALFGDLMHNTEDKLIIECK